MATRRLWLRCTRWMDQCVAAAATVYQRTQRKDGVRHVWAASTLVEMMKVATEGYDIAHVETHWLQPLLLKLGLLFTCACCPEAS